MITVAQPATRPWDGQRILRFLAGLAMLALAVTLRLPAPAIPVTVTASAPPAAVVTMAEVVAPDPAVYEADRAEPTAAPDAAPAPAGVTFTTRTPAGEIPGSHGSRAPPAL